MSESAEGRYGQIIGGVELPASGGEWTELRDPAVNRPVATVAQGDAQDARHAMESAQAAFESTFWASDDGSRRSRALWKLAQLLESDADRFSRLETASMGKTLKESRADIGYVVRSLEYAAGLADKVQGETIAVPGSRLDYTLREPLGVTVHIAPWNYPLLLAMRSVAPALAAGNAAVLKPASLTPLTALALGRLAKAAGIPDGILNVVAGPGGAVGESLITDSRCRSVSFTGSSEVGHRIASLAAARLVPTVLELGGKSPVLVFPDADLDRAAKGIGYGIFGNAGQMCWAGSRLLVHADVHDALLAKLRALADGLRLGPGVDPAAEMGPLVSEEQRRRVESYVASAREAGAHVVAGGGRPERAELAEGFFWRPTVVDGLPEDHRMVREEVFGPVLSVQSFASTEEAVRMANASTYGLFASVWTRELATAHTVARRLEAGMVCVNEAPNSFPQTPFAGIKDSGIGFEQGIDAVAAFTRRKNVLVNLSVPKPPR